MVPTCTKLFASKVPPRHQNHGSHGSPGHPQHGGHPGASTAAKLLGLGTARPRWHPAGVQHQPAGIPEPLHPLSSRTAPRAPRNVGICPNSPQNSTTPHGGTARGGGGDTFLPSDERPYGCGGWREAKPKKTTPAAGMLLECRWNAGRDEDGWQGTGTRGHTGTRSSR